MANAFEELEYEDGNGNNRTITVYDGRDVSWMMTSVENGLGSYWRSGSVTVDSNHSSTGSQSAKLTNDNFERFEWEGQTTGKPTRISFDFRMENDSSGIKVDAQGGLDTGPALNLASTAAYYDTEDTVNKFATYTTDAWYTVDIFNIDYSNNEYDVTINGDTASNVSFDSGDGNPDFIDRYFFDAGPYSSSGGEVNLDSFRMYNLAPSLGIQTEDGKGYIPLTAPTDSNHKQIRVETGYDFPRSPK